MSARASWGIWCDFCDALMSNGDLAAETAAEARGEAAGHGGHRSKNKDICEDCWAEGCRG